MIGFERFNKPAVQKDLEQVFNFINWRIVEQLMYSNRNFFIFYNNKSKKIQLRVYWIL